MNEKIVRGTNTRGKNVKELVELAHTLYDDFDKDLLDRKIALEILEDNEQEADTVQLILKTNAPFKELFAKDTAYRSLQCASAVAKIKRYRKTLRTRRTRELKEAAVAFDQKALDDLKALSKPYLIKQLIKHLPKKEIEKLIKKAQMKLANKASQL
jgi:integrase